MEEKALSEKVKAHFLGNGGIKQYYLEEDVAQAVERLKEWAKPFETIDERDLQNWIKEIFGDLS